jgi:hypothetical protein
MAISQLFDLLDDWRHLPAYQLERRADIFFALYLDKIIKHKTGVDIDCIIPEFPIRLGEILKNKPRLNKSFKIDYLTYSRDSKRVFFVELKTEMYSRNDKQDKNMQLAAQIGMFRILEGLKKIYKATTQKVKYNHLLNKIEAIGWITPKDKTFEINNINITPEILYLQPVNTKNNESIISFDDVIVALSKSNDELAKRFLASLEKWKSDVNKKT